jgi:hypothetical protein
LVEWLSVEDAVGEPLRALTDRGRAELHRARATLGPVRESALHLLTADAFVTYACEAALESSDPSGALAHLVEEVAQE